MYKIGDIAFDEYYVKSVELELDTCDLIVKVIFHKDNKRIEREKHYTYNTNCDVDINEIIKHLETIITNE